jgi:hypothetical protein
MNKLTIAATLLLYSCATNYVPKQPAIVKITNYKGRAFCTATVISPKLALTAEHCLGGAAFIQSIQDTNKTAAIQYSLGRESMDLGVVIGDFSAFESMSLSTSPYDTEDVSFPKACGFPFAGELYCINFSPVGRYFFQQVGDAAVYPGMSGGPIINRWTGSVIGVISASDPKGNLVWSGTAELWKMLGLKP